MREPSQLLLALRIPRNRLAATGWMMPAASGMLIFGGVLASAHGAQGLRKLRRTAR